VFISKYVQQGSYEDTVAVAFALLIAAVCILEMENVTYIVKTILGVK
jgi:hypothetical protein